MAICIGAAVGLRAPALGLPLDRDAAVYAVIGGSLRDGALPYRDLIDHKQPLVYPVYGLLDLIAQRSGLVVHLASALVAGCTAWALWLALRPRIGRARAALVAAVALVLGASRYTQGFDLNTEGLLLLLGTLAIVAALVLERSPSPWTPVLIGLLCGAAVLTKAVGILLVPAALAPLLLGRPAQALGAVGALARFTVGAAVPVAFVVGFFAAHGALADFVTWNWSYNREYAGSLTPSERVDRLRGHPQVLLLIGASGLAWLIWLRTRGRRDPLTLTLGLWLAGATVGALLGGYGYAHYFVPVVAPAAVLLVGPPASARSKAAVIGLAVVALAPFVLDLGKTLAQDSRQLASRAYGEQARVWWAYEPVGRLLRERGRPGDRLHVASNEAGFYWQSDLVPASRLLYDSPLALRPELLREVQDDLCRRPPRFLVLPLGTLPDYASCLGTLGYRSVTERFAPLRVLERVRS
ncbi:MAG: glycosyltransferase family 39 protein [Solirubrobacterales bacterium]|nr:glycosyltransferase family 39 protein [Solirubrobacterales bacterium]